MGLKEWAETTSAGKAEASPVYPYSLTFEPHDDVKSLFPTTVPDDKMAYIKQLESVPADSTLYNIYAYDKP